MSSDSTMTPTTRTLTVIGVDVGVKQLLAAAPVTADPDVAKALVVDGGVARALFDGLGDTLARLDELGVDSTAVTSEALANYRQLIYQRFGLATAALQEHLEHHDADAVALEDLEQEDRTLEECARGETKAGGWLLPAFLDRLEDALTSAGYRVERVDPKYTTQECHVCGELAEVSDATIACETPDCPVDVVCRDRSAAVSIAKRWDPRPDGRPRSAELDVQPTD